MRRAHYLVISHHRYSDFTSAVETLLEQGWTLVGGVSVFGHELQPTYHQAMTCWEDVPAAAPGGEG